ncbi:MAG: type II secretion system protein GspM [Burkholderiales bacterium]
MREQWRKLSERFGALKPRERALVLLGVVVVAALVFDAIAFQPAAARKKELERRIAEARQNLKAAETLMRAKEPVGDSHAVKRSYRDALRVRLVEINQSMAGLQQGMVPPERMARLLEDMLARTRGLQLISLRALPPKRFEPGGAALAPQAGAKTVTPAPKDPERTIFQHSFEITLQGSYIDLHDYLAQLEKLPWQMFWNRISVQTEQYPRLRVTITVQTLSLTKAWLVV